MMMWQARGAAMCARMLRPRGWTSAGATMVGREWRRRGVGMAAPAMRLGGAGRACSSGQQAGTEEDGEEVFRREILQTALEKYVHEKGWTDAALAAALQEMGLSAAAHGMFPRGAYDLVAFFMDGNRRALQEAARTSPDFVALREEEVAADRLAWLMQWHLSRVAVYADTWPQALALGLRPQFARASVDKMMRLADDFCFLAGEPSSALKWYLSRASALAIYSKAELYMLADRSDGYENTHDFIRRCVRHRQEAAACVSQLGAHGAVAGTVATAFVNGVASAVMPDFLMNRHWDQHRKRSQEEEEQQASAREAEPGAETAANAENNNAQSANEGARPHTSS